MSSMDPRLHNLLGGEELAALRQRLRRHFERGAPGTPPGLVHLVSLSAPEREALALLTGRPPREAKSMQIDVARLDASLRDAGIAGSLRDALEQLDGVIVHSASVRAATQARWSTLVTSSPHHPALNGFLQAPIALGLLKRLARQDILTAEYLLACANAVLRRLPASGLARAQLAAETLGNAHALDNGQAAATLVLAAWRHVEKDRLGAADLNDPTEGTPDSTPDERIRDVWARAGVLVNELARPALALNLPVQSDETPVSTPGEPAYLSLRQLLRTPPRWAVADLAVFVCENPNLVAIAADRLGVCCAPMVCTDGMPAAAQRILITQLSQAGARLGYHGDFDWPGIQIANYVMCTWAAHPWRFGAQDYEAAAAVAPHTRRDLADSRVVASWDVALAPAMLRHGLAIAEEAVATPLLEDLRQD